METSRSKIKNKAKEALVVRIVFCTGQDRDLTIQVSTTINPWDGRRKRTLERVAENS